VTAQTTDDVLMRQAQALEQIALALGTLVAFALPTLESIDEKLPKVRRAKRKRRAKRRRARRLPELLK